MRDEQDQYSIISLLLCIPFASSLLLRSLTGGHESGGVCAKAEQNCETVRHAGLIAYVH